MSRKFQFTFDEGKILELLTGHTLYNDSSVVVRETLQNSLDAVRLQAMSNICDCTPEVQVRWASEDQTLEVIDNGTGMTQEIIEQNFLRVGSSRYQETSFRRDYPAFSPISRFGIGVLSTFMVSDEVQVITSAKQEESAREISLRSVQGEYLIRMIRKTDSEIPDLIKAHGHGTLMRIRVRRSADLSDILSVLKKWLVLPRAKVTFSKDGNPSVSIGFPDLSSALHAAIASLDEVQEDGGELRTRWHRKMEIRSSRSEDTEVAYVVVWNPFFQEWSFWAPNEMDSDYRASQPPTDLNFGICIEGIRVESSCPGLPGGAVAAIVNASGKRAPRTNVARTALEQTPELDNLLLELYQAYSSHLIDEAARGIREHGFSVTKASSQVQYLVNPVSNVSNRPNAGAWSQRLLWKALDEVPAFVSEYAGGRDLVSMIEINKFDAFNTYDSEMIRRLESLLTTLPGTITLEDIARLGKSEQISKLSSGVRRLSLRNVGVFARLLRGAWEPEVVEAYEDGLLSVTWKKSANRWFGDNAVRNVQLSEPVQVLRGLTRQSSERLIGRGATIYLPKAAVSAVGLDSYDAVKIGNDYYILPSCPILNMPLSESMSRYEQEVSLCAIIRLLVSIEASGANSRRSPNRLNRRPEIIEEVTRIGIIDSISPELKNTLKYEIRAFDVAKYDRFGVYGD